MIFKNSLLSILGILLCYSTLQAIEFGQGHNYVKNELAFSKKDVRLKYDNNTGQASTSIELPLPHSFGDTRKKISLRYQSQRYHNLGYGVGFDLSLPQLIKTNRKGL